MTTAAEPTVHDQLDSQLDAEFAPGWKPAPGDRVVGEVVAIDEYTSRYGKTYPIVTLRGEDGQHVAVHALNGGLAKKFARLRLEVGDHIGIQYEGKIKDDDAPAGFYHRYRVASSKDDPGGFSWAAYADGVDETAPPDESGEVPADASGLEDDVGDDDSAGGDNDIPF